MNEHYIEDKTTKYAESLGWLSYKFSAPSRRGVPDRLFIKLGTTIFIEFKKPGEKPRKLQEAIIRKIREQGVPVYVVDSIERGEEIFNHYALKD